MLTRLRARRALLFVLFASFAAASVLEAQTPSSTRVRVRSEAGTAVTGALIGLIDAGGRTVAEGLSNADGARSLTVPAGKYRIQVRRIGFEPFISEEMSFPRSEGVVLAITNRAVSLQTVVVTAGARCRNIAPDAAALSTVWEEIAKALRASQLTTEDLKDIAEVHMYVRDVDTNGRVNSNDTKVYKVNGMRPFGAIDPVVLMNAGYVVGNITDGWYYYAPDETVLLSESFARTHCFRIVRDRKRPGQIGMSFEPVAGRKPTEIEGVLWLDEKSSELREILFQFVNVDLISKFEAGGRTHFRRMPSGAWLVDDWSIRFPKLQLQLKDNRVIEIGHYETGGGIVHEGLVSR